MGVDGGPVVRQIADAIAHGMGVLDHDARPIGIALGVTDESLDGRIHRAVDIGLEARPATGVNAA